MTTVYESSALACYRTIGTARTADSYDWQLLVRADHDKWPSASRHTAAGDCGLHLTAGMPLTEWLLHLPHLAYLLAK